MMVDRVEVGVRGQRPADQVSAPTRGLASAPHERPPSHVAMWLFLLFAMFYLSTAKGVLSYYDDVSMLQVTEAIVERATMAVPPRTYGALLGIDGRHYSQYGVGQSLLAIPFYVVGRYLERFVPSLCCVIDDRGFVRGSVLVYIVSTLGIFSSAAAIAILFLSCRELGFSQPASIIAALSLGLGTFAWHYSRTFMSESTSMLAVAASFYGLLRFSRDRSLIGLVVSGVAASWAVLLRPANVIVIVPMGLWLAWELWRWGRRRPLEALRAAALWTAPIALGIGAIAAYNVTRFGTILETGYGAAAYALTTPVYVGLYGFILSPGKSVFIYAPILLAGVAGWWAVRRRSPIITTVVVGIIGIYLLFYAQFPWWYGGGVWGPRYLTVILPFFAMGLPGLIDRGLGRVGWAALSALAALSLFIQGLSILVPYVPYVAKMQASPELLERFLWHPGYSPVLAHAKSLLARDYPLDVAPNYYHSWLLAWFQLGAFAVAALTAGMGLVMARRPVRGKEWFVIRRGVRIGLTTAVVLLFVLATPAVLLFTAPGRPPLSAAGEPVTAYEGFHDVANCGGIAGWVWDSLRPNTPIAVDIYDGDTLLATVQAGEFRRDLLIARKGNGSHAFVYGMRSTLRDALEHSIRVKVSGTDVGLTNTPQVITCKAP